MSEKRIFITGATGLVGSHVARLLLQRGHTNLAALKRVSSDLTLLGDAAGMIDWTDGNVTDIDDVIAAMRGADIVIHNAALISYRKRDRAAMREVNVNGTAHVVNAALHLGVERLVHMSSMSVFTRTGVKQSVDEQTPWEETRYTSHYGLTKHLAELEVWRGKAEGLDIRMLIPTLVMGSGFWKQGSTSMFYKAGKGISFYPIGATGFVDVRDLAELTVLSIERDDTPERMIASGWNASMKEVLSRIAVHAGKRPPSIRLTPSQSLLAARIVAPTEWLTGKEPAITPSIARTTACRQTFDNSLSLGIDGFQYTPLDRTISDIMGNYAIARKNGMQPIPMAFLQHHLT